MNSMRHHLNPWRQWRPWALLATQEKISFLIRVLRSPSIFQSRLLHIQMNLNRSKFWNVSVPKKSTQSTVRRAKVEHHRSLIRSSSTRKRNYFSSSRTRRICPGKNLLHDSRPTLARIIKFQLCKCATRDCESERGFGRWLTCVSL